jgi:DNA-binding NarL/FixJ family response regulator
MHICQHIASIAEDIPYIETIIQLPHSNQAIDIINNELPSLIIMDIRLPGMKGIELMIEIREKFPKPMIGRFTHDDSEQYIRFCRESGVQYFLSKKGDLRLLGEVIKHAWQELNQTVVSGRNPNEFPVGILNKVKPLQIKDSNQVKNYQE